MDGKAAFPRGLGEPIAVVRVVVRGEENALAVIAALDDVRRLIGEKDPAEARHDCCAYAHTRKKINSDPDYSRYFLDGRSGSLSGRSYR